MIIIRKIVVQINDDVVSVESDTKNIIISINNETFLFTARTKDTLRALIEAVNNL